ncbi:MAG: hypothetical protein AAGJ40_07815 [Planctomycetota bacterium]
MQSSPSTFDILAQSENPAVASVLKRACEQSDARKHAIVSLSRSELSACHDALIDLWADHADEMQPLLETEARASAAVPAWQHTLAKSLADRSMPARESALAMRHRIDMSSRLPSIATLDVLLELTCHHADASVCDAAGDALANLCESLGDPIQQQSSDLHVRLQHERTRKQCVQSIHQMLVSQTSGPRVASDDLLDAWLSLASWEDRLLRNALEDDSPLQRRLLKRLERSGRPSVIQLAAGSMNQRDLPVAVLRTVLLRSDAEFRNAVLDTISANPKRQLIANLSECDLPDCLRGGRDLMRRLPARHDAALCHAYSVARPQDIETLAMIVATRIRTNRIDEALIECLRRCNPLEMDVCVEAATTADGRPNLEDLMDPSKTGPKGTSQRDQCTLNGLIDMACGDDARLRSAADRVLGSFTVSETLVCFPALSETKRMRLGRVLSGRDPSVLDSIRDELRHPVLQRRLNAILFAEALAIVDDLIEPLKQIAGDDHQEAKIQVAEALGTSQSDEAFELLQVLTGSMLGSLRDAAQASLRRRNEKQDTSFCLPAFLGLAFVKASDLPPEYRPVPEATTDLTGVWIALALIILGAAVFFWKRRRLRSSVLQWRSDPLTMELSDGFGLGAGHRQSLDRMAKLHQLPHTADLFVSKSRFDELLEKSGDTNQLRRLDRSRLGEVRRRIFA